MSTPLLSPRVVVDIDGTDHTIRSGDASLDSGAVPYAQASLVLPLLDDSTLEYLDYRDGVRVPFECGYVGGPMRPFDLGLSGRRVSHDGKTVTLTLTSDERLLMKYRALTEDAGARAHQSSARAVTNYVLGKIGAALEAGTDDADVTAYWPLTNYCTNPRGETTAGYEAGANTSIVGIDSGSGGLFGNNYPYWRATAAGVSDIYTPTVTSVKPGQAYTASAYFRGDSANRPITLVLHFYDINGALMKQYLSPVVLAPVAPAWARASVTGVAPDGAVKARVAASQNAPGASAAGIEGVMLTDGSELVPFFSGATVGGGYTYAWQMGADASQSTRTPLVERRPELFTMKPGMTAWDFLLAILTSAGLVLWCDERRRWFLSKPENRVIGEQINVSPSTTSQGDDDLSDDDDDAHVSGIIAHFTWTENGEQREAYDTAGTPENAILVPLNRPYPGPGTAASMLARRSGTGRSRAVTVITRWDTTPGMSAQIDLPGAPLTIGRVTSARFDLRRPFMELGTAGLIDVNPGDWLAFAPDLDWDDLPASTDWDDL